VQERQDQTQVSQLPDWAGDVAIVLGIVTGAVTVFGWVVSYLFPEPPRSRPLYEPQRERHRSQQPPPVTLSGELRRAIFNFIMQPKIGIAKEFGIAVMEFILLAVASYLYASGNPEDALPPLPIFVLLRKISFCGLFVIGAFGVFSVARLRWKIVYHNRLRSQGHV
jgi:hypothetical protein